MGLLSAPAALICIQPRARPTHEISSTNRVKESVISPVEPCPLDSHKNRSRERKGKGREKKGAEDHTLFAYREGFYRCWAKEGARP